MRLRASRAAGSASGSAGTAFRPPSLTGTAFRSLGTAALDLLFPPRCPFCGRLSGGVCPACTEALPWTGEADGLRKIGPSLLCAAPLRYDGLARTGLLRLKFQGRSAAARPIGALIARCAAERYGGMFDTVTWVPVSRRRRWNRGYDQAELLSRAACRLWDTAPRRLVEKVQDNPAQSGLTDPEARERNVSGVYRLRVDVTGLRVLLIDDICTTGVTLRSCASVLTAGGAAAVLCVTAALAGAGERV